MLLVCAAWAAACGAVPARGDDRQPAPLKPPLAVMPLQQRAETILHLELEFIRKVCQPTDAELQLLTRDGNEQVRDSVSDYVSRNEFRRVPGPQPNVHRRIRERLARSAREHLSPERAAQFEREHAARTHDHQLAVSRNLVVRIDSQLPLTPKQRDGLTAAFVEQWDEISHLSLNDVLEDDGRIPPVPNEVVSPFLTAAQRTRWARLKKTSHVKALREDADWAIDGNALPDKAISERTGEEKLIP